MPASGRWPVPTSTSRRDCIICTASPAPSPTRSANWNHWPVCCSPVTTDLLAEETMTASTYRDVHTRGETLPAAVTFRELRVRLPKPRIHPLADNIDARAAQFCRQHLAGLFDDVDTLHRFVGYRHH